MYKIVSYNKLWEMLIDTGMKKRLLRISIDYIMLIKMLQGNK